MIIDTHVHIISEDLSRYPLTPSQLGTDQSWYRGRPVNAERLLDLMDSAEVDRSVIVQALTAYGYDNSYHADSGNLHSQRFVGVCAIDPLAKDAAGQLKYWIKERGMQGVR